MGRAADDTRPAAAHHCGMPSAPSPARERRAVRSVLMAFAAVAAVAGVAIAVSVVNAHDANTSSPKDAVRDFLVTSVIDSDGVDACGYLTPAAARKLRAVEPHDETCHEALADTQLVLGNEQVDDEAQVKQLDYRTTEQGDRATVSISAGGGAMTLQLRRATAAELAQPGAPATPWRIDSSVNRLAVG
jgi:hypothetical protein